MKETVCLAAEKTFNFIEGASKKQYMEETRNK